MLKFKIFKRLILIIFIVLFISCVGKFDDLSINTNAKLLMPIANGEYTIGDLFYNIDEPNNLTINTGVFYQITDTIPFSNSLLFSKIEDAELIFRVKNIMPFQVDLKIVPFDTISRTKIGNELFITIVEAAPYSESSLSIFSSNSEEILHLDVTQIEILKQSNGLLIDVTFIWPYENVVTSVIDNFYEINAFNIKMILNAKLELK